MFVRLASTADALLHKYLNLRVLYLGILGVVLVALAMLQYRWIDEATRWQKDGPSGTRMRPGRRLFSGSRSSNRPAPGGIRARWATLAHLTFVRFCLPTCSL